MGTQQVKSRKQAEDLLIQRAQQDETFRRELVANPSEVIARTFDIRVPPELKVSVVEETDRHVYLVLPARSAASATGELAERELAMVAGGSDSGEKSEFRGFFGYESGKTLQDTSAE